MTEPDPEGPFTVGLRVYWAAWIPNTTWYHSKSEVVGGGVVVNPGLAIATVWADQGIEPCMVTLANDRIYTDLGTIEAEVKARNEVRAAEILAVLKGEADAHKAFAESLSAGLRDNWEAAPLRRRWWTL